MNKEEILQIILTTTDILTNKLNVSRTYILYKNGVLNLTTPTYNINEENERLFVIYKENGSTFIEEKF